MLSSEPFARIRARIGETIAEWARQVAPAPLERYDADVLRRLAAHSIGCGICDLRGSELQWIDREILRQIFEAGS